MYISKIHLTNFRNFKDKNIPYSKGITTVIGPNASGKTNVLESIHLLSTGKSFKARIEGEMVNHDASLARISGVVESKYGEVKLEVVLTRGIIEDRVGNFGKVAKKKLLVNGVAKRLVDFSGCFKTVLFGPWDLDLVTASPSLRRRFLDTVLSQIDREYRRSSLSYEKGLRQRNKLLLRIREEGVSRSQLLFWDRLLIKNGDYISARREMFIDYINKTKPLNDQIFQIDYDKSVISEGRLNQYEKEEVFAATTLVGPHRDDFVIKIQKMGKESEVRNLATYGSRGEQRMGVLWLKLAELSYIEEESGEMPVLLLDDIFSELDHDHRKYVIKASKRGQTIITTADQHFVEKDSKVIDIAGL